MLTLLGILVVVVGFALRKNPLLVVLVAALVTGIAAGMDVVAIIAAIGKAFTTNRYMAVGWLVVPLVGVLERAGLKERAQDLVRSIRAATAGRVLLVYLLLRQITSALGLTSLGGQAQMVRPLIAPMAEAAAERDLLGGDSSDAKDEKSKTSSPLRPLRLSDALRFRIRAHAAAADNIGLFFGEDIFIAIGSILLMRGFLAQNGYDVEPLNLAIYAIPTAILAFVIHAARLLRLDRMLHHTAIKERESEREGEEERQPRDEEPS